MKKKLVQLTYNLRILSGNRILFRLNRTNEVFWGQSPDPKMHMGRQALKLWVNLHPIGA